MSSYMFVWAGLAATMIMSLFVIHAFKNVGKHYKIIVTAARMIVFEKPLPPRPNLSVNLLLTLLHYASGIGLAYVYWHALDSGAAEATFVNALIYGVCIAAIAVAAWATLFAIHPAPPAYPRKVYLSVIALGYILLALTLYWIFSLHVPLHAIAEIPTC